MQGHPKPGHKGRHVSWRHNYREANRSRSKADFKSRIRICESEASETQYWLQLITDADCAPQAEVKPIYDECSELLAIFTSIGKKV